MSNYNNLKTSIDANIKQNGNQEITGPILNSVLNQMVNILGTGYQFAGVATLDPAIEPGTPDAKVFYIANGKGKYTNFGGIEVTEDDVVVLYWDTAWHKVATGIASQAKLSELEDNIDTLKNGGYLFAGIATPSTNPGTPDQKVFYIAEQIGTYANFNNLQVTILSILYYDTEWHIIALDVAKNTTLLNEIEIVNNSIANCSLEIGSISTSDGTEETNNTRVRSGFLAAPFSITCKASYSIRLIYRYERDAQGNLKYVDSQNVYASSKVVTDKNYVYRLTFYHLSDATQQFTTDELPNIIRKYTGYNFDASPIFDDTTLRVPTNTKPFVGAIRDGETNYPIFHSVIPIYAFSDVAPRGIQAGQFYYNTNDKKLRLNFGDSIYNSQVFPYLDGAIYVYKNKLYVWNGSEMAEAMKDIDLSAIAYGSIGAGTFDLTGSDFVPGNTDSTTGKIIQAGNVITSKEIRVIPNAVIGYSLTGSYRFAINYYKYDGGYIRKEEWFTGSGQRVLPNDCYIVRFCIASPAGVGTLPVFDDTGFVGTTTDKAGLVPAMPINAQVNFDGYFDLLRPIYAPSPQLPANDSDEADFNAETMTPNELYAAFESLIASLPNPNGAFDASPKYGNVFEKTGRDASDTQNIKAYVFGARNRYAWKHSDKLYAWKNGATVVYLDTCCPVVGAHIYSDINRTDSGKTVASYNVSNHNFVASDSTTYVEDAINNVDAVVLYSRNPQNVDGTRQLALYDKSGISIGTGVPTDVTHLVLNAKTYTRCESLDYHTKQRGTIFIWGNEHGPQSDPAEPAITLYRFAKDLCDGCRNNPFIEFLKRYFRIVMIPIVNPYGIVNRTRNNANNVNINRNYNTPGWAVVTDTDKGTQAGNQNETQYVMNTCKFFDPVLVMDIHCLGYVTQGNIGRTHYEGFIPNLDMNEKAGETMAELSYSYTSYGDTSPETGSQGSDWINYNGFSGGLIEMNAGDYAAQYDGKQHTAHVMHADYTLMLNALRMWLTGVDATLNLAKLFIK